MMLLTHQHQSVTNFCIAPLEGASIFCSHSGLKSSQCSCHFPITFPRAGTTHIILHRTSHPVPYRRRASPSVLIYAYTTSRWWEGWDSNPLTRRNGFTVRRSSPTLPPSHITRHGPHPLEQGSRYTLASTLATALRSIPRFPLT